MATRMPRFSRRRWFRNLNRQLYATTSPEKYATFYFALYEDDHRNPDLHQRRPLGAHAAAHGDVADAGFHRHRGGRVSRSRATRRRRSAAGAATCWWPITDGIVEPENAYGEMFGEER